MVCLHRGFGIGAVQLVDESRAVIFACSELDQCTEADHGLKLMNGNPFPACSTCPLFANAARETFTAVPCSESPTGFGWNCTPAQFQRIGFYPLSADCTVTVEPAQPTAAAPAAAEPVGDMLADILKEVGIKRSACSVCHQWQAWMNQGVAWCEANRARILDRLNEQANGASWFETIKVAGHGYLTTESILDEAIKRASAKSVA